MSARLTAGRPARTWAATGGAVAAAGLLVGAVAAPATAEATAVRTARVNVVHGIPGVAVKICVDGAGVADHFRYGQTIVGAALPATRHAIRVVAAGKPCHATPILKSAYTLAPGRDYTLVANLDAGGRPNLKAFVNGVTPTGDGRTRLTVRHTAQAPAVNVWAGHTRLITGTGFTWGRSATLAVPAGSYPVKVTLPGSARAVIGPVSVTLAAGHAYQVYAVGSPGHYRLIAINIPVGTR